MITLNILRNVRENFNHKGLFINDDTFCRGAYNSVGHLDWNHWLIHVFYLWVWVFSFDYWLVLELMGGSEDKNYMCILSLNLSFSFDHWPGIDLFYLWIWVFTFDYGDQKKKNRYVYFIFQSEFSVLINSFIFESFSFDHGQVLELMPGIRRRAGISGGSKASITCSRSHEDEQPWDIQFYALKF